MPLRSGTRVGEFEIVAPLGAGGMGEVYRARDARLRRDVAIKILPEAFARDRHRVARFEQEARVLASLNHPNIAAIYGLAGSADNPELGAYALVLELVEGETLADRLARGPLAIDETLRIARQIADALEVAHRQKIAHRDLKPANILVTPSGSIKVLDFGLAKALEPAGDADNAAATTSRGPLSMPQMILGTPAYMSPEQARGQPVDERTDIWAFGCVVYEMLIGKRAFAGATSVDLLTAVVHQEPDWSALPASTPPLVRRLLRRCLRKSANERVQHAGDLRIDLEDALAPDTAGAPAPGVRRMRLGTMAALGLVVVAAGLAFVYGRSQSDRSEIAFQLGGGVPITPASTIAISPDGQQIVIAPAFESLDPASTLWLRPIGSIGGHSLAGTVGAFLPFWSPDGRYIGFFANRKLQRVEIQTGIVQTIADAAVGRGAAWRSDGTILFAPTVRGPLQQVSADGGPVTPLTTLTKDQNDHRAPYLLPGEDNFLYYARGTPDVRGVYVARRDGTTIKRLMDADAPAVYSPTGHLLFLRETTLLAQPFDAARLEITGPAVTIAESVTVNRGVSLAALAASPSGTVAYGVSSEDQWRFAWFDRQGKRTPVTGDGTSGGNPSLSPDSHTIAFNRVVGGVWDIWTLDLERGAVGRVTSDPQLDFAPIWTADGRHVVFQSPREANGNSDLVMRATDGSEPERVLLKTPAAKSPTDVSRDGHLLLFEQLSQVTASDIWVMPLTGDGSPKPVLQTPAAEREGQFSADAKWLAYSSNESGQFEVFVQPYPGAVPRVAVSNAGGNQLRWSRDGTELFYIDAKGWLNAVRVGPRTSTTIELGKPSPLFPTQLPFATLGPRAGYVVAHDGQRFLMSVPPEGGAASSIAVILHWKGPR